MDTDQAWENAFQTYLRHARYTGDNTPEPILRASWEEQGRRAYRRSVETRRLAAGDYLPAPESVLTPSPGRIVEFTASQPQRSPIRIQTPKRDDFY